MSQSTRKNKQWMIAGALGFLGFGGLWTVSQILDNSNASVPGGGVETGITRTMIADRTSAAAPEMSWINSAAQQLEDARGDITRLEDSIRIMKENFDAERARAAEETDALLERYEEMIAGLETRLSNGQGGLPPAPSEQSGFNLPGSELVSNFFTPAAAERPDIAPSAPLGPTGGVGNRPSGSATGSPTSFDQGIAPGVADPFHRQITLQPLPEADQGEADPIKTLHNYLPAGSYAPALVLSGVDASTSVTSQSEPVPVVFRITSPAVTAGTRSTQGHRIDLTGCTVTGSAIGDLSSERVYVRLLKLACVLAGGRIFERDVSGYMSGAGKAGARGLVVSREGKLINNAAIAGALGGLAEGVSSIGSAAQDAENASLNDALRGAGATSAAGGVSGAANRLSEYYIERAEQYQPVVSLYGGTAVELVFTEGVSLD